MRLRSVLRRSCRPAAPGGAPVHMPSVRFTRAAFQRAQRSPVGGGADEPADPPAPAVAIIVPPAPPPPIAAEPRPAVVPAMPPLPRLVGGVENPARPAAPETPPWPPAAPEAPPCEPPTGRTFDGWRPVSASSAPHAVKPQQTNAAAPTAQIPGERERSARDYLVSWAPSSGANVRALPNRANLLRSMQDATELLGRIGFHGQPLLAMRVRSADGGTSKSMTVRACRS